MNPYVAVSTVADGPMSRAGGVVDKAIYGHRHHFLDKHSTSPDQTVLVRLSYERDVFTDYDSVGRNNMGDGMVRPSTIVADGLATTEPDLTLFLPLADCIGAVIYDRRQRAIMLSHLGRHNLEQNGGQLSVEYLIRTYGSRPDDLTVYLSPAASGKHYPLYAFNNQSLHAVARQQLLVGGVRAQNITVDNRDTVISPEFYSHSAFLRGHKPTGDRHAIICRIS